MLVNLFIYFCIMVFRLMVFMYKTLIITTFKILAFAIDYLIVVLYAVYYFNSNITVKFASGNEVYFINILVGLATIFLYTLLVKILHSHFPKIMTLLNFVIVFIGITIAIPFTINLISPIIEIFKPEFSFDGDIIISQNHIRNLIYTNILYALIALPIWQHRMENITKELE